MKVTVVWTCSFCQAKNTVTAHEGSKIYSECDSCRVFVFTADMNQRKKE